ncbi:MAG: isoleucine--tRNA ligase [Planctomycetota bacterium]
MSRTESPASTSYPAVQQRADFPAIERRVLEKWRAERTFERSVEHRAGSHEGGREFVFYDGPPFANGLPHFGHLLTGYAKDVIPRYRTMRGEKVDRRFGWDCHGLPAEMESEKQLGISGRQKIQEYGIERFNAHCRTSVLRYTDEWEKQVERQGRWVDFRRDYKTMDLSYMESVLWAFEQLWKKGLLYEGYRVMPYSWAAETPVSNFETRIDNSYRERDDPALTVKFPLESRAGEPENLRLLVWTTTPWTLPSNLAAAVGPEIEYAGFRVGDEVWVLGAGAAAKYAKELGEAERVATFKGSDLVGRSYAPPFDYFRGRAKCHVVLAGDFVDTSEGTGVVHLAPGFGEDDQRVCAENGIELVVPVDDQGRFTNEVPDYVGVNVFEANKPIAQALKQRGLVVRHETYRHNYPHCWRTDQPLIYRAMNSWYVEVTKFKDRMVELNQRINWIPEHVKDGQFGKWLENARDWSISRNRFWGTPIPVWRSDDPKYPRVDVYGSLDALERDFGVRPTDLHRPAIDELVRPNPDDPTGRSMMRRVPDVLDCWFESGSMPFAQVHYPFENREWFEEHFPADFIVEYVAQTRGWFYTLVVLGTALFDKPPFQNVICHGVVVAEDGQKLSKRLRNYPPPEEVFEQYGSDALRWHLMASPIMRGGDLAISRDGAEFGDVVRLVLNPAWNAWYFLSLYGNADGIRGEFRTDQRGVLDRYALAKTRELVEAATSSLDAYDISGACAAVRGYLDALNNWWIRRSRERFWAAEVTQDKRDAYDTLHTCLSTWCKVAAPLLPYLTEEIHAGLEGGESVHLADWPDAAAFPHDPDLVRDMDAVRDVCSIALGLREAKRLRVRLPLNELTVAGEDAERLAPYADLVRDEVNVKGVTFSQDVEEYGSFALKIDARKVGPRVGGEMKAVMAAAKGGAWKRAGDGRIELAGQVVEPGEYELALVPTESAGAAAPLSGGSGLVALDVAVTPELEREGLARDLVRLVQQARRDAGLDVSDRIRLAIRGSNVVGEAVRAHRGWIDEQALCDEVDFVESLDGGLEGEAGGVTVAVKVTKA